MRYHSWQDNVFKEVNNREDHDPHDINKMPVKAHGLDIDGLGFAEIDGPARFGEPDQPTKEGEATETGEGVMTEVVTKPMTVFKGVDQLE